MVGYDFMMRAMFEDDTDSYIEAEYEIIEDDNVPLLVEQNVEVLKEVV